MGRHYLRSELPLCECVKRLGRDLPFPFMSWTAPAAGPAVGTWFQVTARTGGPRRQFAMGRLVADGDATMIVVRPLGATPLWMVPAVLPVLVGTVAIEMFTSDVHVAVATVLLAVVLVGAWLIAKGAMSLDRRATADIGQVIVYLEGTLHAWEIPPELAKHRLMTRSSSG